MRNFYSLALTGVLIACIFTFSILQYFVFAQGSYKHMPASETSYEASDEKAVFEVTLPSPPVAALQAGLPPPQPQAESVPSYIYIVTSLDGYIVVQYAGDKAGEGIHLTTNKAVNALPPEEQERLAAGIAVYTEEALFRLLEDYGS